MEDDFTFPAVDAASPTEKPLQRVGDLLYSTPAAGHYLWPFSYTTKNAPPDKRATALRDGAEDAPPAPGRSGPAAVEEKHDGDGDSGGEDRMDMLWEDFNDVEHPSGSAAQWLARSSDRGCRLSAMASDDAEFEDTSGRPCGCAPTMLRASSRAGGAGQFFTTGRGHGRGRTTAGWMLLLRFFRRLFAVDKTPPSRSHLHGILSP